MKVLEIAVRVAARLHWNLLGGAEVGYLVQQLATMVQLRLGEAVEVVASGPLGDQVWVVVDLGVCGRQVGHRYDESVGGRWHHLGEGRVQPGQQLAKCGCFGHGQGGTSAVDAVRPEQHRVDRVVDDDHGVGAGRDGGGYGQVDAGQRRGGAVLPAGRCGVDIEDLLDRLYPGHGGDPPVAVH
jgi:hypothetical protein